MPAGPIESVLRSEPLADWPIEFLPTALGGGLLKRATFGVMAVARLGEVIELFEPSILHLVVDGPASAVRKRAMARVGHRYGLRVIADDLGEPGPLTYGWPDGTERLRGPWPSGVEARAARLIEVWGAERV